MCRVASWTLPAGLTAPAEARSEVRDRLDRWQLSELNVDALLLVSEVVTNAVLHGGRDIALSLAVTGDVLEVGVTDASRVSLPRSGPDGRRDPGAGPTAAEGGRGLRLLDLVARTWGVATVTHGKQVWFRIGIPSSWPHRRVCPCADGRGDARLLTSGTRSVAVAGPWDAA